MEHICRGGAGGGDTSYTMLDGAAQYFDDTTAWSPDPIFDDGKETDLTRIEQRLVMSQVCRCVRTRGGCVVRLRV